MLKKKTDKKLQASNRRGFTIIEVSIFLAITGLLLIGVLGGTYSSIATQRYNDSLRGFAEFFRQIYGEVISPETLGGGNSNDQAIYGKIAVFGLKDDNEDNIVYTATLVGDVHIPSGANGFASELKAVGARLFCGNADSPTTVSTYTPLWEAKIKTPNDASVTPGMKSFGGTIIIARAPTTGVVHTAFIDQKFNIDMECDPDNHAASTKFYDYVQNYATGSATNDIVEKPIELCVESYNSNIVRGVTLGSDGRNTTAVNILTEEESYRCVR